MAYALIAIILGSFILWHKFNKGLFNDLLSPFNLLFYFWILPLSLRGFGLSGLESPWNYRTILVLFWVTFALALTSLWPACVVKNYPFCARKSNFEKMFLLLRSKVFLLILAFSFLIPFAIYIYVEFITNPAGVIVYRYLSGTTSGVEAFHRWGKDVKAAAIIGLLLIMSPMCYLAFRANTRRVVKFMLLTMALSYPIMGLLKLSKSDFFIPVLNLAIVEHYYRKYTSPEGKGLQLTPVKYAVVLIIFLALFYVSTALRIGSFTENSAILYAPAIDFKLTAPVHVREPLALIYGYTVLPFENFHRFLNSYSGGYNPGISFFRPILSMLTQGDIADAMLAHIDFNVVSPAANTSTFLAAIYAELGLLGLVIVPVIYGVLVNSLYLRFYTKPSFTRFLLYLNFVYPWVWLFFSNGFSVFTFYINAGFIIFVVALYGMMISLSRRTKLSSALTHVAMQ